VRRGERSNLEPDLLDDSKLDEGYGANEAWWVTLRLGREGRLAVVALTSLWPFILALRFW
jgi:hypothetical protein